MERVFSGHQSNEDMRSRIRVERVEFRSAGSEQFVLSQLTGLCILALLPFNPFNRMNEPDDLSRTASGLNVAITANALAQICRLSDVEQLLVPSEHEVDTGSAG